MPDFRTEDILASVRMIEAVETDTVLVFNGNSKLVLETLGIPLQNHKPLENRVETISEEDEILQPFTNWKDLDEETNHDKKVDEIQKLFLDANNSIMEDSDGGEDEEADFNAQLLMDQSFSDTDSDDEEVRVKKENYENIEDFDLNDISISDEEDDENQNKSREINKDEEEDVGTRTDRNITKPADINTKQVEEVGQNQKQGRSRDDLDKEIDEKVKRLMVKDEGNLWKCRECSKTGLRYGIARHAETHLTGYIHFCPVCDHKTTNRDALKTHLRVKHTISKQNAF